MKQYFIDLFKYHNWANRKLLEELKKLDLDKDKALGLLSHILISEKTWLQRLKSEKYENKFWPSITLKDCGDLLEENEARMSQYLKSLSDKDLDSKVTYTNSKGIEYRNTIREILTHLSHHSSYHRGQLVREMVHLGLEPVNTDYIIYKR